MNWMHVPRRWPAAGAFVRRACGSLAVAALLGGCGGGGLDGIASALGVAELPFGGNPPRCADFAYQEDAQAAFDQGLTYLDGDSDGIACEGRPRRDGTTTGDQAASVNPPPPVTIAAMLAADGSTYVVTQSSGDQVLTSWERVQLSSTSSSSETATVRQVGATTGEVQGPTTLLRLAVGAQQAGVGWVHGPTATATIGFGVPGAAASSLAEIGGAYRALGRQCRFDRSACTSVAATLAVGPGSSVRVCPGSEYGPDCAGQEVRTATRSPLGGGVWRIGSRGQNLLVDPSTGAIALSYRTSDSVVTLYGHRETSTSRTLPSGPSAGFDAAGFFSISVPRVSAAPLTADQPLAGFFGNAAGDMVLASITGQMVVWTAAGGLDYRLTQ